MQSDIGFSSDVQYNLSQTESTVQPAYAIWNASVALFGTDGGWQVRGYVKNITDTSYAVDAGEPRRHHPGCGATTAATAGSCCARTSDGRRQHAARRPARRHGRACTPGPRRTRRGCRRDIAQARAG
ncbi:hypothetical protein AB5I41_12935 [Sphingomonas sp. MMS24-JH45]